MISLLIVVHYATASEQQVKRIVRYDKNPGFIRYRKGNIEASLRVISDGTFIGWETPEKHIAYEWDPNGACKIVKSHWKTDEATAIYNRLEKEYEEQENEKGCVSRRCLGDVAYGVGICGIVTAFFYYAFKNPPTGFRGF